MKELNDLIKSFESLKQKSIENLGKLEKINPQLFSEIAQDLSVLEKTNDISKIQEIQSKYANNDFK